MIALVEGAKRQRTPNEIALTLVLSAFTLVFLIVVMPLWPMAWNAEQYMMGYLGVHRTPAEPRHRRADADRAAGLPDSDDHRRPAGRHRHRREWTAPCEANIIAKSGKAVETAGDIDIVLLDKTGTITLGNRQRAEFIPVGRVAPNVLAASAALASLSDETPEGQAASWSWPTTNTESAPGVERARAATVHPVQRADSHERRRPAGRPADPQRGLGRRSTAYVKQQGGTVPADVGSGR